MSLLNESVNAYSQANANLEAVRVLSRDAQVTFGRYVKYVLPLDGYVFWLRTSQIQLQGIVHYAAAKRQAEDETYSINRVTFTTNEEIQAFNDVGPEVIWVGEIDELRFAFTRRENYYRAADRQHAYAGDAVYPALASQLVDLGTQLDPTTLIVSNSLPVFLALKAYAPFYLGCPNPGVTLYPSYLVPDNLRPPYGAVHVLPERTAALQAAPWRNLTSSHFQLAKDTVRVTFYGLTNTQALEWLDLFCAFCVQNEAVVGLMNTPIVRDEKRGQTELSVLAMKKTIELEVSYWQSAVLDLARQMILKASAVVIPRTGQLLSGADGDLLLGADGDFLTSAPALLS